MLIAVFLGGCNKHDDNPANNDNPFNNGIWPYDTGKTGPGTFDFYPIPLADFVYATPLGNLNPPGHTLPSDHVYFYWVDPDHRKPGDMDTMKTVYAPGSGIVAYVYPPQGVQGDYGIGIEMTNTFVYYFGHILLKPGITVGSRIEAGQVMGTTSPYSYALDLGVINNDIVLKNYINPARYTYQTIHTDSPYKYFAGPLKVNLYAKVRSNSTNIDDKNGKIDFDVPGKLIGGWFVKGLSVDSTQSPNGWSKHLAFVYDMFSPTSVRISSGGTLALFGVFGIPPGAPLPVNVSVASGKVSYKLMSPFDPQFPSSRLMIVQMLSDNEIKVEIFPNTNADTAEFTANAVVYTR